MGGLGKTTLAKKVFNKIGVMSHFNCRAWVYASQDFRARDLLLQILKQMQIPDGLRRKLEGMSEDELIKELFEYLKEERYLIVMDDIWTTEDWDKIRNAFPDNSKGSRILITSRIKKVALHVSHTLPYDLPFLNEEDSWELFKKKVFRGKTCPVELEIPGRQIAKGCRGLPLSIVVLAGILTNKEKSFHIWSKYVGHVTTFLARDDDICPKILFLSYTDLPMFLKPCFLYFGIFPEDIEIPVRRLMHLWVAEGFIQHNDDRNIEDVAEGYLEELVDRSLIQVASRRIDRGIKTCRIHDLLRDLCIKESAEEKFLEVQSRNNFSTNNSRRLSILGTDGSSTRGYMSSNPSISIYARSLFYFGNDGFSDEDAWTWVHKNFKLVRVLNFEILRIPAMPKSLAKLIHLRYLRMEFSNSLSVFPDCIGNLTNLETLYVKGSLTDRSCLPNGIFRLKRLRNLYLSDRLPLPFIRKKRLSSPWDSKEALGKLEVLSIAFLLYDRQKKSFPVVLGKFPNVRKLKIQFEWCSFDFVWQAPNVFPCLRYLNHLEILRIEDCCMLPPDPNLFPSTITKLTLKSVELEVGGGLTMLGKLPQLRILKLEGRGYKPNRALETQHDISIRVIADSFPQLHVLKLNQMKIKEWKQETGAMPSLIRLIIIECNELISPPELWSLTTLRDVKAIRSSGWARMLRELQKEVGFKLLIQPPIPD
ncbi:putative late blight resistance protein homolog R1B-17 [Corylus avellana]|uniref:putative late blight resistance protein homolog R1B-17 n=1 Tax=Corylus avellana TaxID=13451 RepID=UPI00286C768B|nr:putative late blight resistance protein homolog R1B-17 [Corylus avellana]